ncbi:hypothetical protein [Candidatus Nitrosocosmicus sp. T]
MLYKINAFDLYFGSSKNTIINQIRLLNRWEEDANLANRSLIIFSILLATSSRYDQREAENNKAIETDKC